jgi:predicted nucleotidyltransferase
VVLKLDRKQFMRLSSIEIATIKYTFTKVFGTGKIYLFGSRVDDDQKGGDIDLYLDPDDKNNLYQKKINFLIQVEFTIGEQKIDIVFAEDPERHVEQEALSKGIKL